MVSKIQKNIFWLLLIIYALLLTHNINDYFNGSTIDYNSSLFGLTAINWLRSGPLHGNFGQYIDSIPNLSHPQFLTLPIWLSYLVFGIGEWQTRLTPIIFSLASLVVFWLLLDLVFKDDWLTVGASFFYVFLPISIYFGRMASHEAPTRFFVLLITFLFFLFEKTKKKKYFIFLLAAIFAGGLIDWPVFYLLPALTIYLLLVKDYPLRWPVLLFTGLSFTLSLTTNLVQLFIIDRAGFTASLLGAAARHMGSGSYLNLLVNKIYHETLNFTAVIILLSLIGLFYFFRSNFARDKKLFLLILFFPAFFHYLVFWGGQSHEFWSFYFTPFIALTAFWGWQASRWPLLKNFVLFYFLTVSVWQTYFIFFPRAVFGFDDIQFIDRMIKSNYSSLCAQYGQNDYNPSVDFYLDREEDLIRKLSPCPQSDYFLFRRWDQTIAATDWQYYGVLNKDYKSAVATAGPELGLIIGSLKKISPVNNYLKNRFNNGEVVKKKLMDRANNDLQIIKDLKLKIADCSANFCLYTK